MAAEDRNAITKGVRVSVEHNASLLSLVEAFQEAQTRLSLDGYDNVTFEIEGEEVEIYAYGTRLENDEEVEKRLASTKLFAAQREQHDLAMYRKLQKKYGPIENLPPLEETS